VGLPISVRRVGGISGLCAHDFYFRVKASFPKAGFAAARALATATWTV
jgi:hypothetical protein